MTTHQMTWSLQENSNSILQEFHLEDKGGCRLVLKYNPRHNSVRINSGVHQRLFFLETLGQLNGKTRFKNEYGMETGQVSFNFKLNNLKGSLVLDSGKYFF